MSVSPMRNLRYAAHSFIQSTRVYSIDAAHVQMVTGVYVFNIQVTRAILCDKILNIVL